MSRQKYCSCGQQEKIEDVASRALLPVLLRVYIQQVKQSEIEGKNPLDSRSLRSCRRHDPHSFPETDDEEKKVVNMYERVHGRMDDGRADRGTLPIAVCLLDPSSIHIFLEFFPLSLSRFLLLNYSFSLSLAPDACMHASTHSQRIGIGTSGGIERGKVRGTILVDSRASFCFIKDFANVLFMSFKVKSKQLYDARNVITTCRAVVTKARAADKERERERAIRFHCRRHKESGKFTTLPLFKFSLFKKYIFKQKQDTRRVNT